MRLRVAGRKLDHFLKFVLRAGIPALLTDGEREIFVRLRIFRIDKNSLAQSRERRIKLALLEVEGAEDDQGRGGIGLRAHGFFQKRFRLVQMLQPVFKRTEIRESKRVGRRKFERFLERFARVVEMTFLEFLDAEFRRLLRVGGELHFDSRSR